MYADDTIVVRTDIRKVNQQLAKIQIEGAKYGLHLNTTKCEVMYTMKNANVKFQDGTKVPFKDEVKYLGVDINDTGKMKKKSANV